VASNRARANRSLGNKINNINSRVSETEKSTSDPHLGLATIGPEHIIDGAVQGQAIADRAVTEDKIARGAIGPEHLGSDTITSLLVPTGSVLLSARLVLADGWLICAGATLVTTDQPELFSAIGYTYGGSGTSFQVPNLPAYSGLNYIIKT